MSRLTDPVDYCWMKCYEGDESVIQENCKLYPCFEKKMWDKLNHYEDLEEAGRLIELPCAVGDTVYKLWYKPCHRGEDYPDSYECCGCRDECTLERAIFEFSVPSVDWILSYMKEFGDLVWFLTKAEAEAKLAELKGGADDE